MLLHRSLFVVLFSVLLARGGMAQAGAEEERPPVTGKNETAAASQLLEENENFRAVRLDLAKGSTTAIDHPGRDAVIVSFGEGLTLSIGASEADHLKDGEAQFVPMAAPAKVVNSMSTMAQVLIVELKQHWENAVHACSLPSKCTRPIIVGDLPIGETTTLFTNGFVTAYQHRLDKGGTLSSSYFSATGKDHVLLIALTDLHVSFDGSEETLKAGRTYSSDATQIEVNAAPAAARWIVIRMQIPKA
jgi:quercetin dioxygenase-like cupin family protein